MSRQARNISIPGWPSGTSPRMDLFSLLASAMISFLAAYLFLPWLIRSLRGTSLVGKDLHKPGKPLIPEMGGVGVILGFYVASRALPLVLPKASSGWWSSPASVPVPGPGVFGSLAA